MKAAWRKISTREAVFTLGEFEHVMSEKNEEIAEAESSRIM